MKTTSTRKFRLRVLQGDEDENDDHGMVAMGDNRCRVSL